MPVTSLCSTLQLINPLIQPLWLHQLEKQFATLNETGLYIQRSGALMKIGSKKKKFTIS